jgi:hypothetical protein
MLGGSGGQPPDDETLYNKLATKRVEISYNKIRNIVLIKHIKL